MKPIHKIGGVVKINIERSITSCLIIDIINVGDKSFAGPYEPIKKDDYFIALFEYEEKPSYRIYKTLYTLETNKHIMRNEDMVYRLLIGDKKVWIFRSSDISILMGEDF